VVYAMGAMSVDILDLPAKNFSCRGVTEGNIAVAIKSIDPLTRCIKNELVMCL